MAMTMRDDSNGGGGMLYGASEGGVAQLLEDIKAELITKVSEQAADISGIESACNNNWQGTAKERFINNLKKDVADLQEGLNGAYKTLDTELTAVSAAVHDFDQYLIDER